MEDFVIKDGVLKKYNGYDDVVIIPDGVTKIADKAFANIKVNYAITIIIPEGVVEIGDSAFEDCYFTEKIILPKSVRSIGKNAFRYCERLHTINIPQCVTEIQKGTFHQCSSLKTIVLSDSIKRIGDGAFQYCASLEEIYMPEKLQEICKETFDGCIKLKSLQIPKGVKKIGDSAFAGCKSLKQIILPDTLEEIGKYAFAECKNIGNVIIPNSVIRIRKSAFEGCNGIKKLKLSNSLIYIGDDAFFRCYSFEEVVIPDIPHISKISLYGNTNLKKIDASKKYIDENWDTLNNKTKYSTSLEQLEKGDMSECVKEYIKRKEKDFFHEICLKNNISMIKTFLSLWNNKKVDKFLTDDLCTHEIREYLYEYIEETNHNKQQSCKCLKNKEELYYTHINFRVIDSWFNFKYSCKIDMLNKEICFKYIKSGEITNKNFKIKSSQYEYIKDIITPVSYKKLLEKKWAKEEVVIDGYLWWTDFYKGEDLLFSIGFSDSYYPPEEIKNLIKYVKEIGALHDVRLCIF